MTCGCEEHEVPRLLAHCGGNEKFPENGMKGFEYSLANGVTGFETDFRMTGDGVIIVIHDSDLKTTTTGEGAVEHMTLEEIKKVKLKNSDESVPTAEEVFSLFDSRKGFFIELEMKARYGELYSFERMDEYLEKLHADIVAVHLLAYGGAHRRRLPLEFLFLMHILKETAFQGAGALVEDSQQDKDGGGDGGNQYHYAHSWLEIVRHDSHHEAYR